MPVLRKIWPCRTGVYTSKDFVDARQENLVNLRVLDFTWKESTSVTTEYILQTLFRAFTKKKWLWQGNRGMFHLLERLQEIALQSFIPRNLKANCGSQRFLVFDNRYWPTIKTRDIVLKKFPARRNARIVPADWQFDIFIPKIQLTQNLPELSEKGWARKTHGLSVSSLSPLPLPHSNFPLFLVFTCSWFVCLFVILVCVPTL